MPSRFDELELRPGRFKSYGFGEYSVMEVEINGRSLKEILKEVEYPDALRDGQPELAGRYVGIPLKYVSEESYLYGTTHFVRAKEARGFSPGRNWPPSARASRTTFSSSDDSGVQ